MTLSNRAAAAVLLLGVSLSALADSPDDVGPPALIPAGDPQSAEFIGPVEITPFKMLGDEVPAGERKRLEWVASMNFSGGDMVSPVIVAQGVRPGPVLCLTAGIHGDELNGVEIVRRVANAVDPETLGGTLIAVPVINLFGYMRTSRYLPDRRDLNRYFPGTKFGSIASRIAYSFFSEVMTHCEVLVDIHTGSFERRNLPQLRADLSRPEIREFTQKLGATMVLHSSGARGMLRTAATEAGIPAVTFEVGGPNELEANKIRHAELALHTLLYKLGMTAFQPVWEQSQAVFHQSTWVRADIGGLLMGRVELGESVEAGQVLGVIIDPINNTEHEMSSPVAGRVIGMAKNQVVLPGFATFHIGEEASEKQKKRIEAQRREPGLIDEDAPFPEGDPGDLSPEEGLEGA